MSGYRFGGSIEFKSEIEGYEGDPVLYGGYPFGFPKVYLNGDGEYNSKFPIFDWEDDSVVVVRGKHILEYKSSRFQEMLFMNNNGETIWVEGRQVANEECEGMDYLDEVRGVQKYTITEYDIENGNKRTYSVALDEATTMTGRDYDRLSNVVDAKTLGSHFEIKEGILLQYIGTDNDLVIPEGVTGILSNPFKGCRRFNSIKIPKTLTHISPFFFECCEVNCVDVATDNPRYYSQDGFLIDREEKELVWAYSGSIIPNDGSVVKIGRKAFGWCSDLSRIVIPEVITEIGDDAFSNCYTLEEIELPSAFANDSKRIFGRTMVKDGDKWTLESSVFKGFSF